jgi:hypothetical protein
MPDFPLQARQVRAFFMALAAGAAAVHAQPQAPCPKPAEITQAHLLGLWRAEFEGLPRGATLLLEKHPDYEGSFTGALNRDGERAQIAADVEKGEFTMEESADGVRVSGSWVGDVVPGSCGREIRGTWQEEKDPPRPYPFVLRKQAAW